MGTLVQENRTSHINPARDTAMGTLVQGWNRMDRRIEVSTSLHATPLWAPSCKKIVLLTLSQHRTPNHPSGCALTALCALGYKYIFVYINISFSFINASGMHAQAYTKKY